MFERLDSGSTTEEPAISDSRSFRARLRGWLRPRLAAPPDSQREIDDRPPLARPLDGELPKGWLTPEEDSLVPARRFWQDPNDPISHYYRWIWEYLAYLPLLCGLERESAVLELGCGHGRAAHGLLQYLRSPGRYEGIDVDRQQIEIAQQLISSVAGNFRFTWADLHYAQTNPDAQTSADDYVFPFDDETFDAVFAASLFTHLMPAATENYFCQTRRVLKPGGKILFSFFVRDYYRGPGTTISPNYHFEFVLPDEPHVSVLDAERPDLAVAYSRERLTRAAADAGLAIERLLPGLWSESPGLAVNEQDLIVLARA